MARKSEAGNLGKLQLASSHNADNCPLLRSAIPKYSVADRVARSSFTFPTKLNRCLSLISLMVAAGTTRVVRWFFQFEKPPRPSYDPAPYPVAELCESILARA
jgi:hypothetical protein